MTFSFDWAYIYANVNANCSVQYKILYSISDLELKSTEFLPVLTKVY